MGMAVCTYLVVFVCLGCVQGGNLGDLGVFLGSFRCDPWMFARVLQPIVSRVQEEMAAKNSEK